MDSEAYFKLISETYEEIIHNYSTEVDKKEFEKLFLEVSKILLQTQKADYQDIFNLIIENYLMSVKAISKLSPGLATGLYDQKYGIILNTYSGKVSDIPNDDLITETTVFDVSSITKLFAIILLLKETENGNIDLNRNFSDYSPLLKKLDVKVKEALRFGVELRTLGRLDEKGISKEELIQRLQSVFPYERNTFIYSDIAYILIPFLFGKTIDEASKNYLQKFYELYKDKLGLLKTKYNENDFAGGSVHFKIKDNPSKCIYVKDGLYDPKANMLEKELGYVSGHAGVTTNINDLQKLFDYLCTGLLDNNSLKELTTTVSPESKILVDERGNPILKNGEIVNIKRALGVYVNTGNIKISDISARYSKNAFAAEGSTGTYSLFDIENGINATYLSNVRSGLFSKWINTENYNYGDEKEIIPPYYQTTLISGTGTMKDGSIIRPDGTYQSYVRSTNNFKEESLDTLLKLRLAKAVLIKKAKLEYCDAELEVALKQIEEIFSASKYESNKTYTKHKKIRSS